MLKIAVPVSSWSPWFSAMKLTVAVSPSFRCTCGTLGAERPGKPRYVAVEADDDLAVENPVRPGLGPPRRALLAGHLAEEPVERHRSERQPDHAATTPTRVSASTAFRGSLVEPVMAAPSAPHSGRFMISGPCASAST